MNRVEITAKLEEIFRRVIGREDIVIEDGTTANDVDGWDSLSHATIITEIEKEFGVKFSIRDMLKWKNVGKMVDSIESKLSI